MKLVAARTVRNDEDRDVVLNKNGSLEIWTPDGSSRLDSYPLQMGAVLTVKDGDKVKAGEKVATWDPHSVPVLSEASGKVRFVDFEEEISVRTTTDPRTGATSITILDSRDNNLSPRIVIVENSGKSGASQEITYDIPTGATVMVRDGQKASPGMLLAKTPREAAKTRDITGGLPRVAELFEARIPKDAAEISRIEGKVSFGPNQRGRRLLIVEDENTQTREEHLIPLGKQIVVFKDDIVHKGQQLTEGPIIPQEILEVSGPQELQKYLVNEVQQVYRLQGVEINDKHIEIIVRQMLRKVRITNSGDTDFLWGEQVTRQTFLRVNEMMMAEGRRPAEAQPALLGITKAALETDSFISAASFQDTTRVLTEAATMGRVDELRGFKENVILGHVIPGGTGFPLHRYLKLVPLCEPISDEEMRKLQEEAKAKMDALFGGSLPTPAEEGDEDEPPLMLANPEEGPEAAIPLGGDVSVDGEDYVGSDGILDDGGDL